MTYREQALRIALREVGAKETPAGSNWGARVAQYLAAAGIKSPAPWCAAFVTWCFQRAGMTITTPGPASVENWEQWAAKAGYIAARPLRADLVCYDWNADNWYDHIGFVVKVLALRWKGTAFVGWVKTVEGNTSVGNDSNGGEVMIRYRWISNAKFVRIPGAPTAPAS